MMNILLEGAKGEMEWWGYLIFILAAVVVLIAMGYLAYREINHMPSMNEECCCSGKTLVKLYHAKKKEENSKKKGN